MYDSKQASNKARELAVYLAALSAKTAMASLAN